MCFVCTSPFKVLSRAQPPPPRATLAEKIRRMGFIPNKAASPRKPPRRYRRNSFLPYYQWMRKTHKEKQILLAACAFPTTYCNVCFKFEQPHVKSALTFLKISGLFTAFFESCTSPSAKQPLRATTSPASTKYLGVYHRK